MDFRYGIHTIELFHRLSQKSFNKVFQHLKSLHFGKLYPDATYHSESGMTKYICTSYCGQGVVLYLYKQKRSRNKTSKKYRLFYPVSAQSAHFVARRIFTQESVHRKGKPAEVA